MHPILPHPALDYDMAETPGLLTHSDGRLFDVNIEVYQNVLRAGNHGLPITFTVSDNVPTLNTVIDQKLYDTIQSKLNTLFNNPPDTSTPCLIHVPVTFDPEFIESHNFSADQETAQTTLFLINGKIIRPNACPLPQILKLGTLLDHTSVVISEPSTTFKKTASKLGLSPMWQSRLLLQSDNQIIERTVGLADNMNIATNWQDSVRHILDMNRPMITDLLDSGIGALNNGQFIKITDPFRLNYQEIKPGKAMKQLFPHYDDRVIKDMAAEIEAKNKPAEFKITFDRDTMRHVYRNGPSSCMTYDNQEYPVVQLLDDPDARPTDALANGDIGLAYLERTDGKVTCRTLIVESKAAWVRIYQADFATENNNNAILKQHLADAGYHEDKGALVGQKLPKIEAEFDEEESPANRILDYYDNPPDARIFLAPYIDWSNPILIEHDNCLEVSSLTAEEPNYLHIARRVSRESPDTERAGMAYYAFGGLVTFDVDSVSQPHTPEPARDDLITGHNSGLHQDVAYRLREQYPGDDDGHYLYLGTIAGRTTFRVNEDQAAFILECSFIDIEEVERPSGEMQLAYDDHTTVHPNGQRILLEDTHDFDLVFDDIDDKFIEHVDSIMLHDGDITHVHNAVWVEHEGDYFNPDDEMIVMLTNGEYCHRDNAYRLPNGDFIHEDDLERA